MNDDAVDALLSQPTGGHVVQFYEDDELLCSAVARFLGAGLAAGEAVLAIATNAHREMLVERLEWQGIDVRRARSTGQLVLLDAYETLSKILRDGAPDEWRFDAVVGRAIAEAARGTRPRVRAYGELAGLVAKGGHWAEALRIEELWGRLREVHPLSLLCAYAMETFAHQGHEETFIEVCASHTHALPNEEFCRLEDQHARLREIDLLQQRARALEGELERRKEIEARLREEIASRQRAEIERAELLEREKAARQEAERANRLKDEFLATLSHELRTPLNAILGWAHALRTRPLDESYRERALATIERNARLQEQLIEDVLDVSRIVAGKLRVRFCNVDLVSVITSALEAHRPAAEAQQVELSVDLDRSAARVIGDPDRLQQVVGNLLSNAIKFTPKGGQITLRLERVGAWAELSVTDTGRGIAPEFLPHVFDRFRQASGGISRSHGGLGLGLSIVRHLVELHGGVVSAHSDGEGRGARFTVRLPEPAVLLAGDAAPERSVTRVAAAPCLAGVRVLVVDDDADTRELVQLVLEQEGADARTVGSVQAAMTVLAEWTPDVLVSDIGMPEEDGYDLVRRLRSLPGPHGTGIPAVALTAYASVEDARRALAAGFHQHIAKPVESDHMVHVIASLVPAKGACAAHP